MIRLKGGSDKIVYANKLGVSTCISRDEALPPKYLPPYPSIIVFLVRTDQ